MVVGRIQVGDAHWIIVGHHGAGGGRLLGNKLNMIKKMAEICPDGDLFMGAHVHADVRGSGRVMGVSLNRGKVYMQWRRQHFSGCGSLLEYRNSYAEAKLMPPAAMCQVVHLLGDRILKNDGGERTSDKKYDYRVHWF